MWPLFTTLTTALLLTTSPVAAAEPPFPLGRWVSTAGADLDAAQRARICKDQRSWMDVSSTVIAFGGAATDAQTCQAPKWRRIDGRTVEGLPRKCSPAVDSLGDTMGELRIVVMSADTLSLNNAVHILCTGR